MVLGTADLVFGACLLLGGSLLLFTLIFDDIFGGLLGAIHLGFDVAGVSPTPMLLGFIAMFGIGGLFGVHSLGLSAGGATGTAVGAGLLGSVVVFGAFRVLRMSESTDTFSLQDMIGTGARVSVAIPAKRFGTVLISFAGTTHNLTATADVDVAAGQEVRVVSVAGTVLVVAAVSASVNQGASDA